MLAEPRLAGWALDYVDIADDEQLLAAYAELIPVLSWPAGGQLLHWPFDAAALRDCLRVPAAEGTSAALKNKAEGASAAAEK